MKRYYECMFLLDSGDAGRDWEGLQKRVHKVLERYGAEVVLTEKLGDRKLAYEIKNKRRGFYYLVFIQAPPGSIVELEREFRLTESVHRLLVLQHDDRRARSLMDQFVKKGEEKREGEEEEKAEEKSDEPATAAAET